MEKGEMIEMLNRAKDRMTDKEEAGRSCMMVIIAALGYIIERMDEEGEAPVAGAQISISRDISGKAYGKAGKKNRGAAEKEETGLWKDHGAS